MRNLIESGGTWTGEFSKLRSTARSVGAEPLAEICSAMITTSSNGDWSGVDILLNAIMQALARVQTQIKELHEQGQTT